MRTRSLLRFLHPRRLWKPLLVLSVLFLGLNVWCRSWVLRGLPDTPEPFDIDAVARVTIPTDQNAFELYQSASDKLLPLSPELREKYLDEVQNGWLSLPEPYRDWLEENRELLEIYRQGSERPDAVYIQPGDMLWQTQLVVTNNLRDFAKLAQLEALRLEAAGDYVASWNWYRTVLRSSRHSGCNGGLIERLVGCSMHSVVAGLIVQWSSLAGVDAALLRSALGDVRGIYQKTVPPSGPIKAEYVLFRKIFADPSLLDEYFPAEHQRIPSHVIWRAMWPVGEPEASHRLAKLMYANWLSQCDLPREYRTPVITSSGMLFSPDPNLDRLIPAEATARHIESWLSRAFLRQLIMAYVPDFLNDVDREDARQRLLETALVVQIYLRAEGRYPESLDELVGRGLDALPIDPFGRDEPLRYRREPDAADGATLWSIGQDGVDDDARVDVLQAHPKGDVILRVKRSPEE